MAPRDKSGRLTATMKMTIKLEVVGAMTRDIDNLKQDASLIVAFRNDDAAILARVLVAHQDHSVLPMWPERSLCCMDGRIVH